MIVKSSLVNEIIKKNYNVIFTRNKSLKITSKFLGKIVYIYNGKNYSTRLLITKHLLGRKIGEFTSTRVMHIYKRKIKAKRRERREQKKKNK